MTKQKVIIITAPSGSGKSTLIKKLMAQVPQLAFSISACTRIARQGEQNDVDYHFISLETFKEHIKNDDFLEWEMVYEGKYYGTLKSEMQRIWAQAKTPLVDIDVKGALKVKDQFKENALSIFIQAPSIDVLKQRLEHRNTDSAESIQERLNKAHYELSFANQFNQILINDQLEIASQQLVEIVKKFLSL